jgi:hypothetical protein
MKKYIFRIGVFLFVGVLPVHAAFAAVALDGAYGAVNLSSSSVTYSHTVTSSDNTILLVGISDNNVDNISSATYDGMNLTLITKHNSGSSWLWLYGMLNPPTGTHNISVTLGSAQDLRVVSASYSGVAQTLTLDSLGDTQNASTASSLTSNTTSVANGAWMFVVGGYQRVPSAGTNSTQRVLIDNSLAFYDSNDSIFPAGSYSMTYNFSSCSSACMSSIYGTLAPAVPEFVIAGSGTANMLAKFTATSTIANALLSDDGSNTTLTTGNFLMPISSMIDTISNGALSFGTSMATTLTFGRSGQNMIIDSNVGIGTSTPSVALEVNGSAKFGNIGTASNCISSASPAVCGSASAGSVAVAAGSNTLVVDTSVLTADSQILLTEDTSLGSRLGVTCNTTPGRVYSISNRSAGASFTIKSSGDIATNPACLNYFVIN